MPNIFTWKMEKKSFIALDMSVYRLHRIIIILITGQWGYARIIMIQGG